MMLFHVISNLQIPNAPNVALNMFFLRGNHQAPGGIHAVASPEFPLNQPIGIREHLQQTMNVVFPQYHQTWAQPYEYVIGQEPIIVLNVFCLFILPSDSLTQLWKPWSIYRKLQPIARGQLWIVIYVSISTGVIHCDRNPGCLKEGRRHIPCFERARQEV